MSTNPTPVDPIDMPDVPGLSFRRFVDEHDFPGMVAANLASTAADGISNPLTVETMAERYRQPANFDPYQDVILAVVGGEIVGYARGSWWDEGPDRRVYESTGFLNPAWRRRGIGGAMFRWVKERLRAIAGDHPDTLDKAFQASARQHEVGTAAMLVQAGYEPERRWLNLLRPTLDDIPDLPLPDGIELRPVLPEHYRAIWESDDETSRDEWGYVEATEADYEAWPDDMRFQPPLWQVAWDTAADQVAGGLLGFIDHEENKTLGRRRGYTERLGVRRPWRRRGIGYALIAQSLLAQRAAGMTESAAVADSANADAIRLFERIGFQVDFIDSTYRKPL